MQTRLLIFHIRNIYKVARVLLIAARLTICNILVSLFPFFEKTFLISLSTIQFDLMILYDRALV